MPVPIITPPAAALRGLGETQTFAAESSTDVTWTCSAGSITPGGLYTPPNRTGTHTVTAMNFFGEASVPVTVTGVLPADPGEGSSGKTEKKVFASQSISRRRQFRTKSGALRRYGLAFPGREEAELAEMELFFGHHQPEALPFYWTNKTLLQERLFVFTSEAIDWQPQSFNSFDYKLEVRERTATQPTPPASTALITLLLYPDYAYDARTLAPVRASEALGGRRVSAPDGAQERSYVLRYADRDPAEFLALEEIWNRHYPGRCVNYTDPTRDIAGVFRFDSDISHKDLMGSGIDFSVAITSFVGAVPLGASL